MAIGNRKIFLTGSSLADLAGAYPASLVLALPTATIIGRPAGSGGYHAGQPGLAVSGASVADMVGADATYSQQIWVNKYIDSRSIVIVDAGVCVNSTEQTQGMTITDAWNALITQWVNPLSMRCARLYLRRFANVGPASSITARATELRALHDAAFGRYGTPHIGVIDDQLLWGENLGNGAGNYAANDGPMWVHENANGIGLHTAEIARVLNQAF
jgi:hypothetical protein